MIWLYLVTYRIEPFNFATLKNSGKSRFTLIIICVEFIEVRRIVARRPGVRSGHDRHRRNRLRLRKSRHESLPGRLHWRAWSGTNPCRLKNELLLSIFIWCIYLFISSSSFLRFVVPLCLWILRNFRYIFAFPCRVEVTVWLSTWCINMIWNFFKIKIVLEEIAHELCQKRGRWKDSFSKYQFGTKKIPKLMYR